MVRLVFRPYTEILRTICTSVSLRASTRVSPGFTLSRHRSPSFGSDPICWDTSFPGQCSKYCTFWFLYASRFQSLYSQMRPTPRSVFQDGSSVYQDIDRSKYNHLSLTTHISFFVYEFKSFNPPFEVLFNFPSWYLFTIGLLLVLRFRWRLPPVTLHYQGALLSKQSTCRSYQVVELASAVAPVSNGLLDGSITRRLHAQFLTD